MIKKNKNISMKKLIILIFLFLSYVNASHAMDYYDLKPGFWAYMDIENLTDNNLIIGYPNHKFEPEKYATRAEYAAAVIKVLNQEEIPIETMYSFDDADANHWAWKYIIRAVNLDIIKPADNSHFYPEDYVTRSEIITFLVNILKSEDITKQEAITALQNAYTDFDDIPDWFKVTAGKAEVLNVIAKEPPRENYLDYDKYVTRAQLAVFMANLKRTTDGYTAEKIKEEKSPKIAEGITIENVLYDEDVATIPAKSVLPVMISGQISSNESYPGEMFQARFANNIVDEEHHLLLSKDIILIGKILDTTQSKYFLRNGELIFELSAANNKNLLTRILGYAECETTNIEANKLKKAVKTVVKGRNFKVKDGQIIYIKLLKPIRVNIVTNQVLD